MDTLNAYRGAIDASPDEPLTEILIAQKADRLLIELKGTSLTVTVRCTVSRLRTVGRTYGFTFVNLAPTLPIE